MSPDDRDSQLRRCLPPIGNWQTTTLRHAAVLCPLLLHAGRDHVLLLVRPDGLRQHAGQIGFPGGMRDPDETIADTARRECHEEIGVDSDRIELLGGLGVRESSSGILVHGLVARLTPGPLQPDPREVARMLLVPLHELRDPSRWHDLPPPGEAAGNQPRTSPHFMFGGDRIWGLTGRFLQELITHLGAA